MIVLDIEATGTNYQKHSIISIGALDLKNPSNQFYDECRIWDGAHINEEALAISGFTKEEVTDPSKKTEEEITRAFIAWTNEIEDHTFAGQNVSFDRDYIKVSCERHHIDYPFAHRTIDVHSLAYMHMTQNGIEPPFDAEKHRTALNLTAVLEYCGVPDQRGEDAHNALFDTYLHAEAISRLLYNKKLLPEFEEFDIPWMVK